MRSVPVLVLAVVLLPFAVAADPLRDDSSYKIVVPSNAPAHANEVYYLSVCRDDLHQSPAVETFDDCSTSGVYQETNGRAGLQVRAGVDSDGIAYAADTLIAPKL